MIFSFFLGLLTGFSLSIPIGPINLTVIHESLRRGFVRGFLIGVGGITADTFYCAMAFLGFSSFLAQARPFWPFLQFAGGIVALLFGVRYGVYPREDYVPMIERAESTAKSHFHKAFPLGFFMGISNISLFVLWGGVNALLISHGLIKPHVKFLIPCIIGITIGSLLWFISISFLIARMHYHISPKVIARITRVCGLLLVLFGLLLCTRSWINQPILLQ